MMTSAVAAVSAAMLAANVAPYIAIRIFLAAALASLAAGGCGALPSDGPHASRRRAAIVGAALVAIVVMLVVAPIVPAADPRPGLLSVTIASEGVWLFAGLSAALAAIEGLAIFAFWPRDQVRSSSIAGSVILLLGGVDMAALAGFRFPLVGAVTATAIVAVYIASRMIASYRVALLGIEGRVPDYALRRFLGAGGMAEVFLAESVGLFGGTRRAAVKRVRRDLVDDADLCELFLEEARLASRLRHPNIVEVYDTGAGAGRPFIVMELVDGPSLAAILQHRAQACYAIPLSTVVQIGVELCAALEYAHALTGPDGEKLHIVHRDVSPQNVMISQTGTVKLIDFGIARARTRQRRTRVGHVRGKLAYSAPEQLRGEDIDARADLFALGVLLYETIALTRPFSGDSESAVIGAILDGRRQSLAQLRPDVGLLAEVIERAMALDPDDRYPDAAAFAAALRAASPAPLPGAEDLHALVATTESSSSTIVSGEAVTIAAPVTPQVAPPRSERAG